MNRHARRLIGVVAALAVAALGGSFYRWAAQDKAPAVADNAEAKDESPDLVAVRKTAEEFAKAFNQGDAKALASMWTIAPRETTSCERDPALDAGLPDFAGTERSPYQLRASLGPRCGVVLVILLQQFCTE